MLHVLFSTTCHGIVVGERCRELMSSFFGGMSVLVNDDPDRGVKIFCSNHATATANEDGR